MLNLRYPTSWIAQAHDALARLADRPWQLFALVLAVNAVARPYLGIMHDARLYSGQVLNYVEGGTYADDLFFRYGSQDQYSLFSPLAAPFVAWLGVPAAFFVLYLLSKSALIWGMIRITRTLLPGGAAVVIALLYCAIDTVRYGAHSILNFQECFFTPRILACALVLIGLDCMLRSRPVWSIVWIGAGMGIHPLMAFGGLVMWIAFHGWKLLGGRAFAVAAAAAGLSAAALLAYEPVASRCFGVIDEDWRQSILAASSFHFPSEWGLDDWRYLAWQAAFLGAVLWRTRTDPEKFRFLAVLGLISIAAVVGAVIAGSSPYALLLQGQPYRALWMLAFLHIPLAVWLCADWAKDFSPAVQLASCVPLAYLCQSNGLAAEWMLPILVFPFTAFVLRGIEAEPRDHAWLVRSVQVSLVAGAIGWAIFKLGLLTTGLHMLAEKHSEWADVAAIYLANVGAVALILGVSWWLVRCSRDGWRRAAWLAGVGVCVQACFFAVPQTAFYREHCSIHGAALQAVRARIEAERGGGAPMPTVYSNLGRLNYVWLDLHSKSYFDWWQAGGFVFRRDTALDGRRRARLVGPFEVAHYRRPEQTLSEADKFMIGRMFQVDFNRVGPSEADLARLCREPNLDYVLIDQEFAGLYDAHIGRLFLYRCRDVREALGVPEPTTPSAFAAMR